MVLNLEDENLNSNSIEFIVEGGELVFVPRGWWHMVLNLEDENLNSNSIEFIVEGGELVFVPRGWWHMVLNLEDSICITQNYVSIVTLPHVLKYFKLGNENLISGCRPEVRKNLFERFTHALQKHYQNDVEIQKVVSRFVEKKRSETLHENKTIENGQINCNGVVKRNGLSGLFVVNDRNDKLKKSKTTGFSFNFGCAQ
eukprot:TRINITY_DN83611_c0_g1_i1.p3 TRINITY_DN83611_c0_g1~~TRINITY_DN83611_c0_g1_i1.p3  ORF type:complete len:199 (-),score=42.29 TRINITY_DN83611_c0_g1_i1:66-662(-)